MRLFHIGVDIGQRVDHSALCLLEELPMSGVVRLLVKYPLGTPYNLLVKTIVELVGSVESGGQIVSFVVDATGVGAAPAQMFQEKLPDLSVESFVFSNKTKKELIGKVKVLHSFGRLRFATRKGDETYNRTLTELMSEMRQLQARVLRSEGENPEIEVFKTGAHDDLFTALALACKNLEFPQGNISPVFIEDKSLMKTPLDEPTVVLF